MNELKWNKKIQPLIYEESQKQYAFELEQISETTVDFYFDIIDAQNNIAAAIVSLQNSSVNYEIEQQRIPLGTTTEDRMLQLNLQMLNSKKNLERAKYDLQMAELKFKTFIGLKDSASIKVVLTKNISDFELDLETALQYAKSNRSEFVAFQRQKLESALAVAKAKSARNSVQLFATLGLNNASPNFANVYHDPKMQQSVSVGFTIPIMDWGRSKAALQTALAAEQLVNFNNQLEEINLEMEVKALIENFDLLRINIKISEQADSIAAKRYNIANELYKQGKLSITELGIAQTEKDNSTRSYIGALRAYWKSYYAIRKLTFYGFGTKQSILD